MTINQITLKWLILVVLSSVITGFWGGVIYSDRVYRKIEMEKNNGAHGWSQLPEGHPPVGETHSGKQNSLSQLEEQAQREPTNPDLHVTSGNRYADQNDYLKAINHYERALKLKPNLPDVLGRLWNYVSGS